MEYSYSYSIYSDLIQNVIQVLTTHFHGGWLLVLRALLGILLPAPVLTEVIVLRELVTREALLLNRDAESREQNTVNKERKH